MKSKTTLLAIGILTSFFLSAQKTNWRTASVTDGANFNEIVKKQESYYSSNQGNLSKKEQRERKQFNRWKAFWQERVLADGTFISEGHNYLEFLKSQKRNKLSQQLKSAAWTLVGPVAPPISSIDAYAGMGRINTIEFFGTQTNTIYIGTPSGGAWKTTNGGNTWTPISDNLPNIGVSDIAINPADSNTLYLATGDYDGVHTRSIGVYKSINGGANWTLTGLQFTLNQNDLIANLLVHPTQTNTVFATTKNSIKKTTDGGATWSDVQVANGQLFNDILVAPFNDSVLIATTKFGDFYYSQDLGNNWFLDSSPSNSRLDITISPAAQYSVYSIDAYGVFKKSYDYGTTWQTISTIPIFDSQVAYNQVIAVSPLDSNLIIVGGVHGWRSTNGGVSWQKYLDGYWEFGDPFFYVHSDHHDMKFIPGTNTVFSGNDGGIFRGNASLNTAWTDLSAGLAITQYYSISGTPQNSNYLLMGAQDNDVSRYNGNAWSGLNPASDGVETLWDYSNSNVAWTCSQIGGLDRTTDGFLTSISLNTPNGAPFVWELEINPINPSSIYGGFADIYKSADQGDNWVSLNSASGTIESIGIAPSDTNVIYVSGDADFRKTINGGTSWTSISIPRNEKISSIAVSPTNSQIVYITYSGYMGGKIYKSIDGGINWSNITGILPDVPAHKVLYKTGTTSEEIFIGTDLGVYYKTIHSNGWQALGTGLPNVIVNDMEIDYATDKLRVATYGRGVWETDISPTALGIASAQLSIGSVELFPNPTENKQFKIQLNNLSGKSEIFIYNSIGTIVGEIQTTKNDIDVDLSSFSTGIYIVKVLNENKSSINKILLK